MPATPLTEQEIHFLQKLSFRGEIRVVGNKDRSSLSGMIKAGYITESSVNISATAYRITEAGEHAIKMIEIDG